MGPWALLKRYAPARDVFVAASAASLVLLVADKAYSYVTTPAIAQAVEGSNDGNSQSTVLARANGTIAGFTPPRSTTKLERGHSFYDTDEFEVLKTSIRDRLLKCTKGAENLPIILPDDARREWKRETSKRFYQKQPWYEDAWGETLEMENYEIIMSILIIMNFARWSDFRKIFIDTKRQHSRRSSRRRSYSGNMHNRSLSADDFASRNRQDDHLPYTKDELSRTDFFGPTVVADQFFEEQYRLCPIKIQRRQEPYRLDMKHRPAFVSPLEDVAEGAWGVVTKRRIAAGYLDFGDRKVNGDNVWIAIKSIADKRIHKEEFENLKELRKCLSKHGSIMVNIATIIQDGGMSGPVHHLIYELAAYDLDVFLTTARGHTRSIRHDSAGPKRTNSALMRPRDLMHESVNLADALEYLHHRLIYTGASISLAHNDIKPGNVLVFYPDGADTEPHCPVGHWKIADFGLSKIKHRKPKDLITPLAEPASLGPSHRRDNSVSKTAPKRAPGRYTAPELDQDTDMKTYGTEADVWSFGCVFAEILAYCIDLNHEHVEELRQGLEEDSKDDRFYDVNNKQVKTSFLNHLESLKTKEGKMLENDAETIKDCVDLINKIVRTDPHARLGAREINNELRSIYNSMSSGLHIDTSQNASESNSIRPSAVQSPKDLNGHLNGDYRFPEFERMTTPTFLFSGLGDDEDSL